MSLGEREVEGGLEVIGRGEFGEDEGVLQKSIFPQTSQLIIYIGNSKGYVDGFVRE